MHSQNIVKYKTDQDLMLNGPLNISGFAQDSCCEQLTRVTLASFHYYQPWDALKKAIYYSDLLDYLLGH